MDEAVEVLLDFVEQIEYSQLSESTVYEVKRRLLDSVACLFGGFIGPPAESARRLASRVAGTPNASVVGLDAKSTLEMASLANSVMMRYLDFNDAPHFSESIPAVLAAAEYTHSDGKSVALGIALSYELIAALQAGAGRLGWDYATWVTVGTALSVGKLLGLSRDQLRQAASISAISNISTWARNTGPISMWKAFSSAQANQYGVFAALLAREGVTGPALPFVGQYGIAEMVTERPISIKLALPMQKRFAVETTSFKIFPCGFDCQGPIELMFSLRDEAPVDEIEAIRIDTYFHDYVETGERTKPAMWEPTTREGADHSLPYAVTVALLDGKVNYGSFSQERLTDPALRPLMDKVAIYLNKDYAARLPDEMHSKLTITLRSGKVLEAHSPYPHGHPLNTCSNDEINEKLDTLATPAVADLGVCHEVRDALWKLEALDDLDPVFAALRSVRARSSQ